MNLPIHLPETKRSRIILAAAIVLAVLVIAWAAIAGHSAKGSRTAVVRSGPDGTEKLPAGTEMRIMMPGDIPMDFVWCPPGSFVMGSANEARYPHVSRIFDGIRRLWRKPDIDETPHKVVISHGFWIGKTEVTQAQWESFSANPSFNRRIVLTVPHISLGTLISSATRVDPSMDPISRSTAGGVGLPSRESAPVENVSWHGCVMFCVWLNRISVADGKSLRGEWEFSLPTEAQWEYACRAGSTTEYPWGDKFEEGRMQCATDGNLTMLQPSISKKVASFAPNAWGIYDMNGNVAEWTLDYYAPNYYAESPETDPHNAKAGEGTKGERVIRGGGHWDHPDACRSAARDSRAPADRERNLGFRVVLRRR